MVKDVQLKMLLLKFSNAKGKILKALWAQKWVPSSRLLKLTGQKYFDRRIRELRDESGFEIETKIVLGEWAYRLKSHSVRFKERRRQYPSVRERREVIERDGIKCNICGFIPPNGEIKGYLQYDHKVPFYERQGETKTTNLQLVCTLCNVVKRRACQICPLLTCDNCAYAYPEKFGGVYVIAVSKKTKERYTSIAKNNNLRIEDVLQEKVEDANERETDTKDL